MQLSYHSVRLTYWAGVLLEAFVHRSITESSRRKPRPSREARCSDDQSERRAEQGGDEAEADL